jgi:23S rRNA pseudouridine1911/1915/1917 synthase
MKKNIFNIVVPKNYHDFRIDRFLQSSLTKLSRTRLQALILDGQVRLNNATVKNSSKKIKKDDKININFPKPVETSIKPNKIFLDILYDDEDLIIINKSPGVVVHPGAGNLNNTIVNGLLFKYKNNLSNIGGKLRPGIVHRIDKDTSGVIVVAKNDNAHINLSKQFSDHSIKRVYETLVWGTLNPKNGKISEKIGRNIKNRQLMSVKKEKGKMAITNYKTLEIFQNINLPKISFLECRLETGRTHQIRVHMSHKGNNILGDATYKKKFKKFKKIDIDLENSILNLNRQFLHAKTLGFNHPINGKKIEFSSFLPQELENILKMLRKLNK